MKTYFLLLLSLALGLVSCQNNEKKTVATATADTLKTERNPSQTEANNFNLDEVPVTTQDVGKFPYLTVPEGYRHADSLKKTLEEKYFFYNDSLVKKISGQYFHTIVFSTKDAFEDTYLVNAYQKQIEKLGGVAFYAGGLPSKASEWIDEQKPTYVADMYDPRPYKYKQFLIRTPQENIWIELCHGLNANQIDLTVVREELVAK
ncbi:MAG: hypothetical protein EOO47_02190 [Flavobacterium sp.]|nr:MAG: hypothetical protein EOO47_02190 [Flavobacterium sp.]